MSSADRRTSSVAELVKNQVQAIFETVRREVDGQAVREAQERGVAILRYALVTPAVFALVRPV